MIFNLPIYFVLPRIVRLSHLIEVFFIFLLHYYPILWLFLSQLCVVPWILISDLFFAQQPIIDGIALDLLVILLGKIRALQVFIEPSVAAQRRSARSPPSTAPYTLDPDLLAHQAFLTSGSVLLNRLSRRNALSEGQLHAVGLVGFALACHHNWALVILNIHVLITALALQLRLQDSLGEYELIEVCDTLLRELNSLGNMFKPKVVPLLLYGQI